MISAGLAWLDHSAEDERRVREIIRLFEQPETQDALGLGQVRDAYGDLLFPGTSTLHSRARYLVFIPWCFVRAAATTDDPELIRKRGQANERRLIETLRKIPGIVGVIGQRAGQTVRNLPSAVYATALRRYGIQLVELDETPVPTGDHDGVEVSAVPGRAWHRRLPAPPPDFPYAVPSGFDLTLAEAEFLRARMAHGAPGSLLEFLVLNAQDHLAGSALWDEPLIANAPAAVRRDVELAHTFSAVMHGANLVYNLLVAEQYEQAGFTEVTEPVNRYQTALEQWAAEVELAREHWNPWAAVRDRATRENGRIGANFRLDIFAGTWYDAVLSGEALQAGTSEDLRHLVAQREVTVKRRQSRLTNDGMLARWGGGSGSSAFAYRWTQVQVAINDLCDGLRRGDDALS